MGKHAKNRGHGLRPIFEDTGFHHEKPDYKTAALCKQVARAVGMALAGECSDPVLQALTVEEVLPAPNAGRLLVRVRSRGATPLEVLPRLEQVKGLLRASVAGSIARKRTPELLFDVAPVMPSGEVRHE